MERVFPRARSRGRIQARFLTLLAQGVYVRQAMRLCNLTWPMISTCQTCTTGYREIYKAASDCGNAIRKMDAEECLHKRGTLGWQEPVYFQGKRVGAVRKFDSHALELYLKSTGDPKYRDDAPAKSTGAGLVVNIVMPVQLGVQAPAKVYDVARMPEDSPQAVSQSVSCPEKPPLIALEEER